jgi:hypothetical protein
MMTQAETTENQARADEFAQPGTLKHFLLRHGFMPDNEEVAEVILVGIIREWEELTMKRDGL